MRGSLTSWALGLSSLTLVSLAQADPSDDGAHSADAHSTDVQVRLGDVHLRPLLALRVRGEFGEGPMQRGGDTYTSFALQDDDLGSALPERALQRASERAWWRVAERARVGLAVGYGQAAAVVELQDARALGTMPLWGGSQQDAAFAPSLAYLEFRSAGKDPRVRFRVGRQRLAWGEGRLLGKNEWQPRGGALDVAQLQLRFSDRVRGEVLAGLLALPRPLGASVETGAPEEGASDQLTGSGAQLYGLRVAVPVHPWLAIEAVALGRIVRAPVPATLHRGDTYTMDLRFHGDQRGFAYSGEVALQLGRIAGYGINRSILALASAVRASWQTSLPANMRFDLFGAYASGDSSDGAGDSFARFDPILPDIHKHHGLMDLYGWSNVIEGGMGVGTRFLRGIRLDLHYTFVGLAEPNDRWSLGSLAPVGAAPNNRSHELGHEVDIAFRYNLFKAWSIGAGYGAFVLGKGGNAIMQAAGRRQGGLLHYSYLQTQLRLP